MNAPITTGAFRAATPFPHAVIDGLWNDDQIDQVAAAFPHPDDRRWLTYPDPKELGKRCLSDRTQMDTPVVEFIAQLLTPGMTGWLTELTGIPDLSPDLLGGGMHLSTTGSRLGVHRDFNRNDHLARRLNLLVFLTDQPDTEDGGTLILGQTTSDTPVATVRPARNRTVIFECGPASWHGHPVPIESGWLRKSIAVYYYSPIPDGWPEAHSTVWETA